ncbi:hypothetical protein D915_002358 [Fasciola hepatica]|uniref:Uncharacterized protein n=1 Tax=Fasciola hepatica TaxID=6192 RepID=A0A4E0RD43_FASHE|nr:hypothetical protein D915_002358 [Fasciola hepatica]
MTKTEKTPTKQAESTRSETKPAASTEQEAAEATKEGKTEPTPQEQPALAPFRSIVLRSSGGSKCLRMDLTEEIKPEKNEIEVKVDDCRVNFLDIMVRQGLTVDQDGIRVRRKSDLTEEIKPEKNEIEVKVDACWVNFLDIMVRQGLTVDQDGIRVRRKSDRRWRGCKTI